MAFSTYSDCNTDNNPLPLYNSYASYFKEIFGSRAQKLSIRAGFSCPNRDGSISFGGCTFCNNDAFTPSYCANYPSISKQIDEGIRFHQWRYRKTSHYLAYFQSYSNTYAPLDILKQRFEEALNHPLISGLVIGTRPDCVDDEKLDYIASLASQCYVSIEYGIESCYDRTLQAINRGHDFATTRHAIQATTDRHIHCGAHMILGLPGESINDMIDEVPILNSLQINSVKFHQLQILRGSSLANQTDTIKTCHLFSLNEYISLVCDIVERLRPDIAIERFAGEVPPRFQALPERSWRRSDGCLVRNEEIAALVNKELLRRNSRQGLLFK